MSKSLEASYRLMREARQAAFNARVSATTEKFYYRYREQYEEMIQQGFADYIPDEMEELASDLNSIQANLTSDPAEARDISMEVGSYIHSLWSLAKSARKQFEQEERLRQERFRIEKAEKKTKQEALYFSLIKTITNPIEANFAQGDLEQLRKNIGSVSDSKLRSEFERIKNSAKQKTEEWKAEKKAENSKEIAKKQVEDTIETIDIKSIEDKEAAQKLTDQLIAIQAQVDSGKLNTEDVKEKLKQVNIATDDMLITEDERRKTVKAIMRELRRMDFTITPPVLKGDFVIITATRPSGKRVRCKLDLKGKLHYTFDKYEGMTCVKDIEKFNVDLESIYSVKLSVDRVIWENPDRLTMDADRVPKTGGRKENG